MFVLMLVCEISGLATFLFVLFLLFKRIVVLDAQGQPTTFEFPVLGKIKTQSPLLVPIFLSAGLIVFPVTMIGKLDIERKQVRGVIKGKFDQPRVLIIGQPDFSVDADEGGVFSTSIPLVRADMTYRVVVLESKKQITSYILDDKTPNWRNIEIIVQSPSDASTPGPAKEAPTTPAKPVYVLPTTLGGKP